MRSAVCAASQLPGKGPTDVDVAPVPARSLQHEGGVTSCIVGGRRVLQV